MEDFADKNHISEDPYNRVSSISFSRASGSQDSIIAEVHDRADFINENDEKMFDIGVVKSSNFNMPSLNTSSVPFNNKNTSKMIKSSRSNNLNNTTIVSPKLQRKNTIALCTKEYEKETLHRIIENEDDKNIVREYETNTQIKSSLKYIRNTNIKNNHMLDRHKGIDPNDFMYLHVEDSYVPGEKIFENEQIPDMAYDPSEDNIDFVQLLIFNEGSTFLVFWRCILLTASFLSPYYYAYIAHKGYDSTPYLVIWFECIFLFDILL